MAWNIARFFNRKVKPQDVRSGRTFRVPSADDIIITEDTAMQVSAFYRGVMYIATQVAKLPWNIKDSKNKIIEDDLSFLLGVSPNQEMNSMFFRIAMIYTAIVRGNSYAEIVRSSNGRVKGMYFLDPRCVDIVRSQSGELLYRVSGSGKQVILTPNEVYHIKNFHTKDGITGLGLLEYAELALKISKGADTMASALFNNGGMPSGTLELQGTLTDEAFARLKSQWKENHSGRKAAGVAILENGTKFNPISLAPDVLQFLDSRKFGVLEVARFLGLPPTKLFDIDANSYNTQEQSNLEVGSDTLDAWCRNLEMEADVKVLNNRYGGRRSDLDLYQLFRGDMTVRSNYFSKMMQSGAMTPNEIRVREGMAPYEGGDRYYIAVNNFSPADKIDDLIDSQIKKGSTDNKGSNSGTESVKNEFDQAILKFLERK